MMTRDECLAVHNRWIEEGYNQKKALQIVDEIFAPELNVADPTGQYRREKVRSFVASLLKAFPDIHLTTDKVIVEGETVAAHLIITGTHNGEFMGIPATGKRVTYTATAISQLKDGKVIAGWQDWDLLGILQQIGAVPKVGAISK